MGLFEKLFGRPDPKVPSPEESRQRRAKFEQRLRNPDWALVAEVLGEVPPSLQALYETDVVLQSYWEVNTGYPEEEGLYEIGEFEALDSKSREHMWPDLQKGCLTFASDGFGNCFFLKSDTGPEWPVYFYDHEGGGMILIADSLDEFLSMLQPAQDDE